MNKPMSDEDDDLLMQNFRVLHSREVNSSVKAAQLWLIFDAHSPAGVGGQGTDLDS